MNLTASARAMHKYEPLPRYCAVPVLMITETHIRFTFTACIHIHIHSHQMPMNNKMFNSTISIHNSNTTIAVTSAYNIGPKDIQFDYGNLAEDIWASHRTKCLKVSVFLLYFIEPRISLKRHYRSRTSYRFNLLISSTTCGTYYCYYVNWYMKHIEIFANILNSSFIRMCSSLLHVSTWHDYILIHHSMNVRPRQCT